MTSRRVLLTAAAGIAAAAALPVTGVAALPGTLARRREPVAGGTQVARTPFALSHLVVAWNGAGRPAIRTRSGSGWSDWAPVRVGHHGRADSAAGRRSALVTVPDGEGYEVDCCGEARDLSVTELNTATGRGAARQRPGGTELRIAGRSAPVRYLDRVAWGADKAVRGAAPWPPRYAPVQTLTVHYTAGANDDPDPAATVRAIHYYDAVTRGWGDMGYNLLIDEAGTVYEGRRSGTRAPLLGPAAGNGRPQMVTGAHVTDHNRGNAGVVLLGDFADRLPTPAAREALTEVLALLAGVANLNPLGSTTYADPSLSVTRKVSTIAGHRDYAPTDCPGGAYYLQLPALRKDVARLLHG
ncbi:N-acetylmuramoyl-L-alanine amidase [Micromonospora pattaloongensis]|uniref:N-acetylmuramoyl-L-alanine amidase n=1 Tax=Micromonospora pattaloongensis TaxID=405436 RepID=A0A1H3TBM2_9ACTN|nr:peptidoglycan recognition family protein [Micromonospora pattaloongensis]SDZ47241.1 N-acetylmuramoyl-L-alanine amidase [Micromonospora pattaloongensis]